MTNKLGSVLKTQRGKSSLNCDLSDPERKDFPQVLLSVEEWEVCHGVVLYTKGGMCNSSHVEAFY